MVHFLERRLYQSFRQQIEKTCLCLFVLIFSSILSPCQAETVRGMYGVSSVDQEKTVQQLQDARVTAVFVPPDQQVIAQYKKAGFQVYLTLNIFGGTEAWKKYPDSVPVTASGKVVPPQDGGVCPTHFSWREERLELLASWLKKNGTAEGVDGVWLDFVRYSGRWEEKQPKVPDTCYCPRCLQLFQTEKGVNIPDNLQTKEAVQWIHNHAELQWLQWKQEQISSFVRDARSVVEESKKQKIKLGVFLVPWTQGEQQGAVLTQLAQDASQLSRYVDVLSPMVYHEMVGQPVEWIGDISEYFLDMTDKPVWPIIQSGKVSSEEFDKAVQLVSNSGAESLLVFTFPDMRSDLWPFLKSFEGRRNLLPNPGFKVELEGNGQSPWGWQRGNGGTVHDTQNLFQPGKDAKSGIVGIVAGLDRQGSWKAAVPLCEPGKTYSFSADFFREELKGGTDYPEIEVWGQKYLLNTHRVVGQFQPLRVSVQCPANLKDTGSFFSFNNNSQGSTFWLRNPALAEELPRQEKKIFSGNTGFFPIGSYGGSVDNLPIMKDMGLNSAVVPMSRQAMDACVQNEMHCLLSVPHDTEDLLLAVDRLEERIRQGKFSFYVNDEPEIHSFPHWKSLDIQRILHDRFPGIPTSMAIVRPQGIAEYAGSSDFFMLDQYPVPFMPMTWLSASMDQAAGIVGRNRLQSVIQAFGGGDWSSEGWPRLPTFSEMNCLAFLSIIHGSRGVYFFTFPVITSHEQGKKDFRQVISRLQTLQPWLEIINRQESVSVEMLSANKFDPAGNPAVHCAYKEKDSEHMLLCVNAIPTYTQASLSLPAEEKTVWREFFDGSKAMAVNGTLQIDFLPLEVKVFVDSEQ